MWFSRLILGFVSKGIPFLLVVMATTSACFRKPPKRTQAAIDILHEQTVAYVAEANEAFEILNHREKERLQGMGLRIVLALDALDRWGASDASEDSAESETPFERERVFRFLHNEMDVLFTLGEMEVALERLKETSDRYPEWAQLHQALEDLEATLRAGKRKFVVQHLAAEVLGIMLGGALRGAF